MNRPWLLLLVTWLTLVGCDPWTVFGTYDNPLYCDPGHPCTDPSFPFCDAATHECIAAPPPDLGVPCRTTSDCPDAEPVCEAGKCRRCAGETDDGACQTRAAATPRCRAAGGTCVACRLAADCAAEHKTCEATSGACVPCATNETCTSGLCQAGACADAGTLLYVDAGGRSCPAGPGQGTLDDPFCKLQGGLDAAATQQKVLIVRAGTYPENLALRTDLAPITIRAVGVGKPAVGPAMGAALTISPPRNGQPLQLTLEGFVLRGGTAPDGNAMTCTGENNHSLTRLTLRNSTLEKSAQLGLDASNCDITLDRVVVGPENAQGGIKLNDSDFTITSSLVARNGTGGAAGSGVGGISTSGTSMRAVVANVTVADNAIQDGAIATSALACTSGAVVFNLAVAGNRGGVAEIDVTKCMPDHSAFAGAGANSRGNLDLAACTAKQLFAASDTFDYHPAQPAAAAPCSLVDQGAASFMGTPAPGLDLDGTARPQRQGFDIGAYEVK